MIGIEEIIEAYKEKDYNGNISYEARKGIVFVYSFLSEGGEVDGGKLYELEDEFIRCEQSIKSMKAKKNEYEMLNKFLKETVDEKKKEIDEQYYKAIENIREEKKWLEEFIKSNIKARKAKDEVLKAELFKMEVEQIEGNCNKELILGMANILGNGKLGGNIE